MRENPLISVIVPVYKAEGFLDRCVESLGRQSYKNLEIILVDDGSPDKCPQLCDAWAQRDSRIRVIHKENGGLSDARNKGVQLARGEYICFVDSDDYVSQDHVEYLLRLLLDNNADISCGGFRYVYGDENPFDSQPEEKLECFDNVGACYALMISHCMPLVSAWGKLFPAQLVRDNPYPLGRTHEDEATTYKYYFQSKKTVLGTRVIYAYYQNPASITHNKTRKNTEDTIAAFEEQCAYFQDQGCRQSQITAAERLLAYIVVRALRDDEVALEFIRDGRPKKYLRMGLGIKSKMRYYGYIILRTDLNELYHKILGR